jgi:hypothetical protein
MLGAFQDNARTRMEFLELLKHRGAGAAQGMPAISPATASCLDE